MYFRNEKIINIKLSDSVDADGNHQTQTLRTWLNLKMAMPEKFNLEALLEGTVSSGKSLISKVLEHIDMAHDFMRIDAFDPDTGDMAIRMIASDFSWTFKFNSSIYALFNVCGWTNASVEYVDNVIGVYENENCYECLLICHTNNILFGKKIMVITDHNVCLEEFGKLEVLTLPMKVNDSDAN